MPKVSIIVPVYNVEKYLAQCLNSLVNQTLKEIEIICVNDGAKDSSGEILMEFAQEDSRIKIVNQRNQGISAARNSGISIAEGEYLGFVDSDDWVDLDYFEKLYHTAKENDCDIACAGFKRCGRIKSSVRKSYKESRIYTDINDKVSVDNLPEHNYVWNKIYRRSKWNFVFPAGKVFEDMAIVIKILYSLEKMVTVPNTYYNYRKTPNSLVTQQSIKNKKDFMWAKQELYLFASEHDIKLINSRGFIKKEIYKVGSLTILKIYHYEDIIKFKLFGFIPILSKTGF